MTEIVRKMSTLSLTGTPFLPELSKSESSGDRLAAVVILKFKFNFAYLDWLVQRLVTEVAFIAFHAAGTLLGGARLLGPEQRATLRDAVNKAQAELRGKGLNDERVHALLTEVMGT